MKKKNWFGGPYPWLVSTIAFLLNILNYFIKGDLIGGVIFLVSAVMFFINFLIRIQQK